MTQPKTRLKHMLRYSPKPIEAYTKVLAGKSYGPAHSKLLDTPESWNLAYLSHDYVAEFQHKDPMFTTHVRRTLQTKLDGTGLGIGHDPTTLVGSLLSLPAPRFVYLLRGNPHLVSTLPLFTAYGETWLATILNRERLCEAGSFVDHWAEGAEAKSLGETVALLTRIRRPPPPGGWTTLKLTGLR